MNSAPRLLLSIILAVSLGACSSPPHQGTGTPIHVQADEARPALARALADADRAATTGLKTAEGRLAYRQATEKAVALWLTLTNDKTRAMPMEVTAAAHDYRLHSSWPRNLKFDELMPAHQFETKALKKRIIRDGIGAMFVAHWRYSKERKGSEPFMTEMGYVTSVTATLEFHSVGNGPRTAALVLHDPRENDTVNLSGQKQPLAADFSAFGEYLLTQKSAQMPGLKALVNSGKYMDKLGLIALEHPAKDRIPVILVHGLMSRPATWQNVVNELNADPSIQKHYQFYLFRYPSGVPVLYSAEKFRAQLKLLHGVLEAEGNHTYGHHMVLIGHSMGGLVSKMQIQTSGDRVWVSIFGDKPESLGVSGQDVAALRSYLEFNPNPYVDRVIFVSTPHRGSSLASGTMGAIGRRLISLPGRALGNTFDVLQGQAPQNSTLKEILDRGVPNSIDNLSPTSRFVKTSNALPLRPGVHVHSIIGNKDLRLLTDPKCSDGVVPYSSAHLEGVDSELVVHSDHGAHETPEALDEMRRILKLHAAGLK